MKSYVSDSLSALLVAVEFAREEAEAFGDDVELGTTSTGAIAGTRVESKEVAADEGKEGGGGGDGGGRVSISIRTGAGSVNTLVARQTLLDARGAEAFQALHGDEMLNQLVASAFDAYDRDLNAVLTFDEFLRWADANPAVQEILAVFGN